jgi:hypothetical protein
VPVASARSAGPVSSDAGVDFPLCPDAGHEDAVRHVLVRCREHLGQRLGDSLAALVLTGSFSRGEGSVMTDGAVPRVLGDIEFLVVLSDAAAYRRLRTAFAGLSGEVSDLVRDRLHVDIEFGPVELGYFRHRARPSIFVYDLVRHGKVVAGPPEILRHVPAFAARDIPREDAVHLVLNRMIEQLEAYDRADALAGQALRDATYQRTKLVLDLAGSALAFAGRHEPSYAARPPAFARLLRDEATLARALPSGFLAELEEAARLKLAPGAGADILPEPLAPGPQRAWIRNRIAAGVPAAAAVLRWELRTLLAADGELPELLARWMRGQPWRRRAWDWAKALLHPSPPPVPLGWTRAARLALASTPRALLCTAGALAYLNLHRPTARPPAIGRLLFVRRAHRRHPAVQRRTITSLWRWCVRNS